MSRSPRSGADISVGSPLAKAAAGKSPKKHLHLLQEEPKPDTLDWYGNVALHHMVIRDPPDISRVKELIKEYPEGLRIKNQFGRIPLHCAVDKIFCNAELVQILVNAYPEGACIEDDDGYSPLSFALRWEHSDAILKMILMHNRYQYRGLYFAIRYGVLLGNLLHCMERAFRKPKIIIHGGPNNVQSATSSSNIDSSDTMDSKDSLGQEQFAAPTVYLSPTTPSKRKGTSGQSVEFNKGFPEIILNDDDASQDSMYDSPSFN